MGMPMRKQTSMVASRMKISMLRLLPGSVERHSFGSARQRIRGRPEENALDDEQQQADSTDRNRQVGDADRQEREIRDGIVPGHFDQPAAPADHEGRDQ